MLNTRSGSPYDLEQKQQARSISLGDSRHAVAPIARGNRVKVSVLLTRDPSIDTESLEELGD